MPSIRLNRRLKEGSRAWCGRLVPSLLPQTKESIEIVLCADPLPTSADSLQSTKILHFFQRFTKLLPLEKFALYGNINYSL